MARSAPDPHRNGQRHQSSRTQRPTPRPAARPRRDRRRFWVQVMATVIILAMLAPVFIFLVTL